MESSTPKFYDINDSEVKPPSFTQCITFEDVTKSPYPLVKGHKYVVSSWNSNTYVEATGKYDFKTLEHYGCPLKTGKEYLVFCPSY